MTRRRVAVAVALVVVLVAAVLGYRHLTTSHYDASIDSVEVVADGTILNLHFVGGVCDKSVDVDVDETDEQVQVGVRVTQERTSGCADVGVLATVSAHLDAPLGDRMVVDRLGHRVQVKR